MHITKGQQVSYKSENNDSFVNKALDAMPKWALATIGCLMALTLFLTFSGFDNAFQRMATAYAVRIERSVESLEDVTKRLDNIETNVQNLEARVTAIEIENAKFHKGK